MGAVVPRAAVEVRPGRKAYHLSCRDQDDLLHRGDPLQLPPGIREVARGESRVVDRHRDHRRRVPAERTGSPLSPLRPL